MRSIWGWSCRVFQNWRRKDRVSEQTAGKCISGQSMPKDKKYVLYDNPILISELQFEQDRDSQNSHCYILIFYFAIIRGMLMKWSSFWHSLLSAVDLLAYYTAWNCIFSLLSVIIMFSLFWSAKNGIVLSQPLVHASLIWTLLPWQLFLHEFYQGLNKINTALCYASAVSTTISSIPHKTFSLHIYIIPPFLSCVSKNWS